MMNLQKGFWNYCFKHTCFKHDLVNYKYCTKQQIVYNCLNKYQQHKQMMILQKKDFEIICLTWWQTDLQTQNPAASCLGWIDIRSSPIVNSFLI